MFIDVHCHLDFFKERTGEIVKNFKKKNVGVVLSNGTNVKANRDVLNLAEKFENVKVALGLYPLEALSMSLKEIDSEIEFIKLNRDKILAIGEVGMDFKERKSEEKQRKVFEKFVRLAIELGKPVIVHSRKAELECIEMLEKLNAGKVVMHCFSGRKHLVERVLKNGWCFSIPANVVYLEHFQQMVLKSEIGQLLCETDSPFLSPFREGENEPANVVEGYKKIAELKGLSLKEVEKKIEENFNRVFY